MTDAKKEDKKEPTEKPKSDVSKETSKGAEEELKIKRKQINEIEKEIKEQHELFNTDYNIIDTGLQDVDDMNDPSWKERWRQITKPDEGVPGDREGRPEDRDDGSVGTPSSLSSGSTSSFGSVSNASFPVGVVNSWFDGARGDSWTDAAEAADRNLYLPVSGRLAVAGQPRGSMDSVPQDQGSGGRRTPQPPRSTDSVPVGTKFRVQSRPRGPRPPPEPRPRGGSGGGPAPLGSGSGRGSGGGPVPLGSAMYSPATIQPGPNRVPLGSATRNLR